MTASRDLAARVEALLDAEASMTPGPWRAGSFETFNIFVPCDDALAPELGRVLLRMNVHFPFVDDAAGIATLRNDAAPLVRDLLAALREAEAKIARLREKGGAP